MPQEDPGICGPPQGQAPGFTGTPRDTKAWSPFLGAFLVSFGAPPEKKSEASPVEKNERCARRWGRGGVRWLLARGDDVCGVQKPGLVDGPFDRSSTRAREHDGRGVRVRRGVPRDMRGHWAQRVVRANVLWLKMRFFGDPLILQGSCARTCASSGALMLN